MKKRKLIKLEKGIFCISISALAIAFFGLFVKLGTQISAIPLLIFLRFIIPFLLISLWILFRGGHKVFISKLYLKQQLLRALFIIGVQFALFYYLSKGRLLNGIMLWNSAPIFIPLIAWAVYRQKVSKITWCSLAVGLVGVACIIKPTKGIFDYYSLYGLLAGIGMACSQVIYGFTAKKHTNTENLFYIFGLASFFSSIILFIYLYFEHDYVFDTLSHVIFDNWINYLILIGIALCSMLSQAMRGYAYRFSKPASLAPFLYISVILAGILQWLVFRTAPDFLSIIGSILIILASLIKWSYTLKRELNSQKSDSEMIT